MTGHPVTVELVTGRGGRPVLLFHLPGAPAVALTDPAAIRHIAAQLADAADQLDTHEQETR